MVKAIKVGEAKEYFKKKGRLDIIRDVEKYLGKDFWEKHKDEWFVLEIEKDDPKTPGDISKLIDGEEVNSQGFADFSRKPELIKEFIDLLVELNFGMAKDYMRGKLNNFLRVGSVIWDNLNTFGENSSFSYMRPIVTEFLELFHSEPDEYTLPPKEESIASMLELFKIVFPKIKDEQLKENTAVIVFSAIDFFVEGVVQMARRALYLLDKDITSGKDRDVVSAYFVALAQLEPFRYYSAYDK